MAQPARNAETDTRRTAMLKTAFCPFVRAALDDPATIEVMANPDGSVWVERAKIGRTREANSLSAADRERVIRLVASAVSDHVSELAPIVSAELPGSGERFEGCMPPVSVAPCFSIRKPAPSPMLLEDYLEQGAISSLVHSEVCAAIRNRENIVVAGGTSSGKTTFANAMLASPYLREDRVVVLEDTRELKPVAQDIVSLRTHRGIVTLQDLVRSTLRLRPDRIIVGEVRGSEALDLLKAWNTGHPGGITTLHANSAIGALRRLEQLALEASARMPHELIADAVDVVIFMTRESGQRRIAEAIRILGFNGEGYDTEPLTGRKLSLIQQGDS